MALIMVSLCCCYGDEHDKGDFSALLRWGVPARHGDIPNAYVKAGKGEHLDIYVAISQGMKIQDGTLRYFGVQDKSNLALHMKKSLSMASSRRAACGANRYSPGWGRQDLRSVKPICACTITKETM